MKRTWIFLFLILFLSACAPQPATPTAAPESDSPPVLRVAYSKNADPWVYTEGEGARQVANSINVMEVRLSSDGQVLAFKRDDTGALLAVNADGSNPRTLVGDEFLANHNAVVWAFDFAPDSHIVYFTLNVSGGGFEPFYDLYRVDTDAALPTLELVREPGQGGIATFSPDGQWMTLYHPGDLDLARVDGSEAHTIFSYPEGYEPATFGPQIVWKPDSSGFSIFHNSEVIFVPIEGDALVGPTIASPWGVVSPDGQNVGYSTPDGVVHIVDSAGNDQVYPTDEPAYFVDWAPDSEHFVIQISKIYNGQPLEIPYLGSLGETPAQLTDSLYAQPIVWIGPDEFLYVTSSGLHRQRVGEASTLLDDGTAIMNIFEYVWMK